ncbi:MAG TPA: hypothetical protein VNK95_01700 [Caldilineaceae bacterium]|nr:hypothetical protein [Caldilineaceae bacterium]
MSLDSKFGGAPYDRPSEALPPRERTIFRPEALQHYRRAQQRIVLPRLVSPRFFLYLWLLAALLLAAGFAIAFWPVLDQLAVGA